MDELKELEEIVKDHFGGSDSQTQIVEDDPEQREQPLADDSEEIEWDDPDDLQPDERIRDFLLRHQTEQDEEQNDEEDETDDSIPATLPCCCNKSCGEKFSRQQVTEHIYSLREMEKSEKEMYIMGTLNQIGVDKTTNDKRKRTKYQYKFNGSPVCRDFFKVAYDTKEFTLRSLIKHMNANGLVNRVHGNTGKKPKHALVYQDVKRVFDFIVNYADIHGMPQPAAPRGRDNIPPVFLHSSVTKKSVHELYIRSCEDTNARVVQIRSFCGIWSQCCEHIQIASPRHDVCAKCEKTRKKISDSVSEEDILRYTREMQDHINKAQRERDVYHQSINDAKLEAMENSFELIVRPVAIMSSAFNSVHYTFDFAQNVSIPHRARQMGPLYFLTPRKVQIFGFRNDSVSQQLNYLIDEDQTLGQDGKHTHGANAVVSMVDDGLTRSSFGEQSFKLHADNCGGQNKNRYVMGYPAWRVMVGLNSEITYMMQVPGHGRCLVDAGFAHLKRKYRTNDVDCLQQLATLVEQSSVSNTAVMFDGEGGWLWRDWKSFISAHFLGIKGIRSYQHFRFHTDTPGVVHVKRTSDDQEVRVNILKDPAHTFIDARRPDTILPAGLSNARKDYLYKAVRPYVRPQYQDITCPAPGNAEE